MRVQTLSNESQYNIKRNSKINMLRCNHSDES